jgi:nickel transport protein
MAMRTPAVFLATLLGAATTQAHDLWIERDGTGYELYYGHRHSDHGGQHRIEYRPDAVQRVACFDATAKVVHQGSAATYPARLAGDCAVAYALLSTGYWTKTPYGTQNVPKDQVKVAISAWLSFESAKRIERWGAALARPLTQDLEVVPLDNPLTLGDGDKLRLLVSFRGQPVAGAVVSYDGKPRGDTGPDGLVNVRIHHGGLQAIEATLRRPLDGKEADEEVHTATLNFALGGQP